jgi:hypothetical protein
LNPSDHPSQIPLVKSLIFVYTDKPHKSMPAECLERRRLARKVAEAVAAVYALRDQKREAGDKRDTGLSVRLDQAKIAQRDAERALHDHIEEHGCLVPKEPTRK